MPRNNQTLATTRRRPASKLGLLDQRQLRSVARRAARPGSAGLIGVGPGFAVPRLLPHQCEFPEAARSIDASRFAANLILADIADPADWLETRNIGKFLHQTLRRFVGNRMDAIDDAFDLCMELGPVTERYSTHESEIDPRRILLTFRVGYTFSWINLTPTLERLALEHELLPTVFYHLLDSSLSRWFRVFNVWEAQCKFEMWKEWQEDEKAQGEIDEKKPEPVEEPQLPACIRTETLALEESAVALARTPDTARLIAAAEELNRIATQAKRPILDQDLVDEFFYDTDPPIPLIALAFGEHDAITELLNMELKYSGQVEADPCPILLMDGTDPQSVRNAFALADTALNTLAAASQTLRLIPEFEPLNAGRERRI